MRIVFVIQSHTLLPQLSRLLRVLSAGCQDKFIIISHDGDLPPVEAIAQEYGVQTVLRSEGGRGRFGLLGSYLSALKYISKNRIQYDWLMLLSGQDYPVRSLAEFEDVLAKTPHDGYFWHFDAFKPTASGPIAWSFEEAEGRYLFQYRLLKTKLSFVERALLRYPRLLTAKSSNWRLHTSYGFSVGRRATDIPFTDNFKCFGGAYSHILRKRAVDEILRFVAERPDIVRYFELTMQPDEALIPTILCNNKDFDISPEDLRYYDFSSGRLGHPKILTKFDLPLIDSGNFFFARKFDLRRDVALFDELDARALER
jgi:hypothetical protein